MAKKENQENAEEFSFINEKIKRKPLNKRRIVQQVCFTVFLAIVFGIVASVAFTIIQPYVQRWIQGTQSVEIPQDEAQSLAEQKEKEAIDKAKKAEEQEEKQPRSFLKDKDLEISDYQKLQRKIYAVGKEANQSIVIVQGLKEQKDWFDTSFESSVQASGIIVAQTDTELLILTEKKVITDVKKIQISFIDTATVSAQLKNYDGNTGLAILSVKLNELSKKTKESYAVATLGNSLSCAQGQAVLAIGSPLGTPYSILQGNITSVNNTISTLDATYSVFTTDMISSKSGSGALLNMRGEVIGLVMQGYSNQEEEATLTAISISNLKWLIEQLSNGDDIPYLGLKISTVTDDIAKEFDMPKGVYVKTVEDASPARMAGVQSGDVIIKMDGTSISTIQEYEKALRNYRPNDTVTMTIRRQDGIGYSRIKCAATVGVLR
ncbi:MAG: S1C family serine protease [Lachnospiraceae bacterium]